MRRGESGIVLPWVLLVAIGLGWTARSANRALSLRLRRPTAPEPPIPVPAS